MIRKLAALPFILAAVGCTQPTDVDANIDNLSESGVERCNQRDRGELHSRLGVKLTDNDVIEHARMLTTVDDTTYKQKGGDYDNTLWDGDTDWFEIAANDVSNADLTPSVKMGPAYPSDNPIEHVYTLCAYAPKDEVSVECEVGNEASSEHPDKGALEGCCGIPVKLGFDDDAALGASLGVDSWLSDDSTTVYVSVEPGLDFGQTCEEYVMYWAGVATFD